MRVGQRAALVLVTSAVALSAGCVSPTSDTNRPATFDEAVTAAKAKDFRRAFEMARATAEQRSTFAPAYQLLADAAFMMGQPQAAVESFAALAQRDAANVHARWGLALCYRRLGRHQDARAAVEQALEIAPGDLRLLREFLLVARAQQDLDRVFAALDERRRRPGAPVAALTYAMGQARGLAYRLREGEILIRESSASGPLLEAYVALADIEHELGRPDDCAKTASQGLELARQLGSVAELEGELLLQRSECHAAAGRDELAEADGQKAMEVFQAWGGLAGEADARRFAGLYLNGRGQRSDSLEQFDRAIAVHEALGEDRSLAWDLTWRTYPYMALHRDEAALVPLARALTLSRRAGDRAMELRVLSVSAIPHMGLSRYGDALRHLLIAFDTAERYAATYYEMVNAGNLANIFLAIGDLPRAREFSERALSAARRQGNPRDVLHARSGLAWTCLQAGDNSCGFEQHRQVVEQLRNVNDGVFRDALDGLALGLKRQGRLTDAAGALNELLEASRAVRDASAEVRAELHLGDLRLALHDPQGAVERFEAARRAAPANLTDHQLDLNVHVGLGAAKAALGRSGEALAHYREAIELAERVRSAVKLASLRVGYFAEQRRIYEQTVDLLYELHRTAPTAGHDREAFLVAEQARARTLLEALVTPQSEVRQMRRLRERARERIARVQARLFHETLDEEERASLKRALAREEKYFADVDLERLKAPPEPTEGREPEPATWQTARAALPEDGLLVEYLLGSPHSYLFVVSKDAVLEMHRLPERAAIEDKVRRFRELLTTRPTGSAAAAIATTRRVGADLFATLLGSPASRLTGARQLFIVPDGILFYLPFEALAAESGSSYLGERLTVAYVPSASVLAAMRNRPVRPFANDTRMLVAFGDPKPVVSGASAERGDDVLFRGLEEGGFRFSALPASRREVETIARVFGRAASKIYLGEHFREQRVLDELSHAVRYVHFATHAVLDEQVPTRSGIVVTRGSGSAVEDGLLQAREIADLHIDADLVTLSACQTGLGPVVGGEGVLGLARAFQEAGARSLVVSLWNVSDASTAAFMTEFYRALTTGASKTAALRAARVAMLRSSNPTLRHPYYWAPFVLLGAP